MAKYIMGIDFGTLSGRAILVDVATGDIVASRALEYPNGVLEESLPDGVKLPKNYALQIPGDYLEVLTQIANGVMEEADVSSDDVIGLGLDFTSCTVLPVDAEGRPLCERPEFRSDPLAYALLWKHHGANEYARRLTEISNSRGDGILKPYGGKASSESLTPRIWQMAVEDPNLYETMDSYMEAGDWLVRCITGESTRNECAAAYKALYNRRFGFPPPEFYESLDKSLKDVVSEKLKGRIAPIGTKAGEVSKEGAKLTGLKVGTVVSTATVDAHAGFPGAMKSVEPGSLLLIIGTSGCQMLVSKEEKAVPGVFGIVQDGLVPGYIGYEAGQSSVGDLFAWLVDFLKGSEFEREAAENGMGLHEYLTEKSKSQKPGEHGLLVLDWFNGNRSVLNEPGLTGAIIGLTLQTKPEDIYRALIESTAFGVREILENFKESGVAVSRVYATGGVAMKNPMLMQVYADVLNTPIRLGGSDYGSALGSAVLAAAAVGKEGGGYDTVEEAMSKMARQMDAVYEPNPENARVYERLYRLYHGLYDYFGRHGNDVMFALNEIKEETLREDSNGE